MEKDQEETTVYKICGKSFSSGKSIGGHMRSHLAKKVVKKPKVHISNLAFFHHDDDDDNNDDNYVLNDYKKRSFKVSNDEISSATYENETKCKECGKEFPSVRSLCGHMRWHTVKPKGEVHVCIQCGKEFGSMRALFGHMTHHSRKARDLNESADRQSDFSGIYSSSSDDIDSDEIEEAALSLMMLSRGITQWVSKGSVGTKITCNFNILGQKKNKRNRQKKLGTWGSCSSFLFEKEDPEFDELDLFSTGDVKKDEMKFSDDDSGKEFHGFETKNKKRKRAEPGKSFKVEKLEHDDKSVGLKNKGLKKRERHICRICSKVFQTRKSLGSHKKAHKYDVANISMKQEVDHETVALLISSCGN